MSDSTYVLAGLLAACLGVGVVTLMPLRILAFFSLFTIALGGIVFRVGGLGLRIEMLASVLLTSALLLREPKELRAVFSQRPIKWFGFYVLLQVASSAAAVDRLQSMSGGVRLSLNLLLAASCLAILSASAFVQALQYAAIFASSVAVLQTIGILKVAAGSGEGGVGAYMLEPNLLGQFLTLVLLITLVDAGRSRRAMVTFVLCAVGIPLTQTRSAVLGLVVGLLLVLFDRGVVRARSLLVLLSALALLLVVAPQSGPRGAKLSTQLLDLRDGTGAYRVVSTRVALDTLSQRRVTLLTGTGTESFGQTHMEPTRPGQSFPAHLGNLPVQLLYDGGLLGAATFISGFVALLGRGSRRAKRFAVGVPLFLMAVATNPFLTAAPWVIVGLLSLWKDEAGEAVDPPGPLVEVACGERGRSYESHHGSSDFIVVRSVAASAVGRRRRAAS